MSVHPCSILIPDKRQKWVWEIAAQTEVCQVPKWRRIWSPLQGRQGFQSRYKYMKRRWRPSIGSASESKVWCSECSVNYNNMLGMVAYPDRPAGSKSLGSWRLNLLLAPCFCYSCPSMILDLHSVLHWVITGPTAGYQVCAQLTWREWEWRPGSGLWRPVVVWAWDLDVGFSSWMRSGSTQVLCRRQSSQTTDENMEGKG